MQRRSALFVLMATVLAACGSESGAPATSSPYGVNVGNVIEDNTFTGRRAGIASPREPISLASFKGGTNKFLVINVAAFWCSPCKEEAKEFQANIVPKYGPKGVAFLSVVLEDSSRQAAKDSDVDLWISTYNLTFPVVNDLDGFMTGFFDKNSMPLNMVINLQTMKIEKKIVGADLARLQTDLDQLVGGS